MARTVTLLRNPPEVQSNPRRRRRRRNPDLVSKLREPIPDVKQLGAALIGAAVVMQVPTQVIKTTSWTNVLVSGALTIGGALAAGAMKLGNDVVMGFAMGGSIITLGKALHVATNGSFGFDPLNKFIAREQGAGVQRHVRRRNPVGASPDASPNRLQEGVPAAGRQSMVPTGAFRDTQFSGSLDNEPILI